MELRISLEQFHREIRENLNNQKEDENEKKEEAVSSPPLTGCTCKTSRCAKGWCPCVKNGTRCSDGCRCKNCENRIFLVRPVNEPHATRGCTCRRRHCLQKYCECFETGKKCDPRFCRCQECENL